MLFYCADFCVAIFRAANSGCSEQNPVKRDLCSCRFSSLPGRNGRKLVDDRGGTTHVSFRFVGRIHSCRECRFIPPHQSLTRQLPPKGKPFCESLFALHDKMMSESNVACPHPSPAGESQSQPTTQNVICHVRTV